LRRPPQAEEIAIAKACRPIAKLVPLERLRWFPGCQVKVLKITYIAPDFDDPLPEDILRHCGY
jgi:antitoxin (DNA-binding transcriptional repressor) of toxin-antitoxin stability system